MTDVQPNSELANSLKTDNVFLFIPNLIGYARVFLALLSFWYMPTNCYAAGFCYLVSLKSTLLTIIKMEKCKPYVKV